MAYIDRGLTPTAKTNAARSGLKRADSPNKGRFRMRHFTDLTVHRLSLFEGVDKMLHMARLVRVICCLCAIAFCSHSAQEQTATPASARDFVRQFYAWYVPVALATHREPSFNIAIREKQKEFSRDLYQALKNDSDAQRKAQGDIVGLDFDPFLNTQDTCKRYDVGNVTQAGSAYRVEVFSICSGKRSARPDVVAEVQWTDGHWEFVNFIYPDMKDHPDMANLLAVLKSLQQERQKAPH